MEKDKFYTDPRRFIQKRRESSKITTEAFRDVRHNRVMPCVETTILCDENIFSVFVSNKFHNKEKYAKS
ncbi:hypothetical protein LOAG_14840 [Loa loa]|uniref:Uncharacterized protein n=1 Tax=Loa loa TaxID=7209 RepID=A0A1S0TH10_LOALO|nr:hypothetical protein LOAG_14840 [Loa loa]EFO13689.1 hypothetical protein LOAG_14840 [Loa loa]